MFRATFSRTAAASLMALAGALGAQGALAQQAGTYTGVTSEGLPISIIVESDGVGGFVYTQNQTQWTMTCTKGGNHTGYWFVGAYVPIVAGKHPRFYFSVTDENGDVYQLQLQSGDLLWWLDTVTLEG